MAHHITEPTELFPHLEYRDLQIVQEVKALIQDHLYSGARDYSFQNALVDFYIRTNSLHAMDILCKVREPLDKPLLDKLNDTMKAGAKLQSLTLLSHIVRRQPSWLYKIVQTNLYASLLQCLKTSSDCPVIMCGLLTITTLLPMIPSLIGPSLHDIFEIFARFVEWNLQRPGNVPEVYHLHIQTAVYTLFHRLYGMFPCNFLEFLRECYSKREQDMHAAIVPMLERVRLHPQLILGSGKIETEAARWRKMEVHDILTECSRISLDLTESAREESSSYNVSATGSESGRASSGLSSIINQARRTSSPLESSRSSLSDQKQKQLPHQRPLRAALEIAAGTGVVDPSALIWSPSVFCGLTTPPSSRPGSPGGSLLDASFNSSLQLLSSTNTPTPLNTPRDSPGLSNLTDDVKAAGYGGTENSAAGQIGRSSSASKLKGKVPPTLRSLPMAHKTVSAPSTPGYAERKSTPSSPFRKHGGGSVVKTFNFEIESNRGVKLQTRGTQGSKLQRSREPSGESSDSQRSGEEEGKANLVSMKDLPLVIKGLPGNRLTTGREVDDMEVSNELSAIADTSSDLQERERQEMDTERSQRKIQEEDASLRLPFKVDLKLSEIPCEKLKGQLERRKEQLLSEAVRSGVITDEGDITRALQDYCRQLLKENSSNLECTDKSLPIPVPQTQTYDEKHCQVCSSSGKSIEVTEVTGNTPLSSTLEGGFTPIRDRLADQFKSTEVTHNLSNFPTSHVVADTAPSNNIFPYALTQSWPLVKDGAAIVEGSLDFPSSFMTPQTTSRGSSVMGGHSLFLSSFFSPHELLDRHIQLGDTVHTKELSMLPLTSQTSVNWTHFGGAAPVDEVNILKNQVIFLHNQVLYERHKREVHAERNRRLLGKTHKAKACQELNIAMKDQVKLQEHKIQELQSMAQRLRDENCQLKRDLSQKEKNYNDTIKKLEKENTELKECNQELQKLLVEHKGEVDLARKKLQTTKAELFNVKKELHNAQMELGTTKRLKDEITWLNKELLLLGEVNQKLREKTSQCQLGVQPSDEHFLAGLTLKKELLALKETLSEKVVQLNAAKTRITDLESSLTSKDVAINEQKRYLETVKSLSKGRIEAIESKYNAQKKINQRQESKILRLTKDLKELTVKETPKHHHRYMRTNSEQIAESLKLNKPSNLEAARDRRASWHYADHDMRPRESTPVKDRIPSVSSISPVESRGESPLSSPGPHQKVDPVKGPAERIITTPPTGGETTAIQLIHGTHQGGHLDRNPPVAKINFSPSSPFERVHSSHSESSSRAGKDYESRRSRSWPHSVEGNRHRREENGEGYNPMVVDLSEGKRALVEDEASHVGDESLASILEIEASFEGRHQKES